MILVHCRSQAFLLKMTSEVCKMITNDNQIILPLFHSIKLHFCRLGVKKSV